MPGAEHGDLAALTMNGGHLTNDPTGHAGTPLPLKPSRPLRGCVCVKSDLRGEHKDLVQTLTCEQVEVGRGPGTPVDEAVLSDPHGLVPPRNGARGHHRVVQRRRSGTRPPEGHPLTSVVVEGHHGHAIAGDPTVRDHVRDQGSDRGQVAATLGQEGGQDGGRRQLAQLTSIAKQELSRTHPRAGPNRPVATTGALIVEMEAGQRTCLELALALVGDEIFDADTGTQQGDQHRARGGADEGLEITHVDPRLVLKSLEGADHPCRAENAPTAEHQPPTGCASHRRESRLASLLSTSSASESTRHWPRTSRSGMVARSPFSPKYTPPS